VAAWERLHAVSEEDVIAVHIRLLASEHEKRSLGESFRQGTRTFVEAMQKK
jgi:hypothetical protein